VDPGNIVPRKYFGFQERIFNFGWEKVSVVTVGNAKRP
jgi:hypothetical protein